MALRNIYLKIETIPDYSPVEPSSHAAANYRRDCMRNTGHEDGTIPLSEVDARRLDALIYREYLDPGYLIPKPDKLVLADVNEPPFAHRVPGTVIYAHPGDHLHIRVFNADSMPHSFHVHGLGYGIDSDGSWPFGTPCRALSRSLFMDGRTGNESRQKVREILANRLQSFFITLRTCFPKDADAILERVEATPHPQAPSVLAKSGRTISL